MHRLLASPVTALLCLVIGACGQSSGADRRAVVTGKTATSATRPHDRDGDYDSLGNARYDPDDGYVLAYGHLAMAGEARAVTTLVRRYYAAAAVGNGATACSLVYAVLAETIPDLYGRPSDRSPSGITCATVMSRLFKEQHAQLLGDNASLQVTAARIQGDMGVVLLRFTGRPDRHMRIRRERGRWTIRQLFDAGLR